jgi:hypothetical protein
MVPSYNPTTLPTMLVLSHMGTEKSLSYLLFNPDLWDNAFVPVHFKIDGYSFLPSCFWDAFSLADGLVIDDLDESQSPWHLKRFIYSLKHTTDCGHIPIFMAIRGLPERTTLGEALPLYWLINYLSEHDIDYLVDGHVLEQHGPDIVLRKVFIPIASHPRPAECFVDKLVSHHKDYWSPYRVHMRFKGV